MSDQPNQSPQDDEQWANTTAFGSNNNVLDTTGTLTTSMSSLLDRTVNNEELDNDFDMLFAGISQDKLPAPSSNRMFDEKLNITTQFADLDATPKRPPPRQPRQSHTTSTTYQPPRPLHHPPSTIKSTIIMHPATPLSSKPPLPLPPNISATKPPQSTTKHKSTASSAAALAVQRDSLGSPLPPKPRSSTPAQIPNPSSNTIPSTPNTSHTTLLNQPPQDSRDPASLHTPPSTVKKVVNRDHSNLPINPPTPQSRSASTATTALSNLINAALTSPKPHQLQPQPLNQSTNKVERARQSLFDSDWNKELDFEDNGLNTSVWSDATKSFNNTAQFSNRSDNTESFDDANNVNDRTQNATDFNLSLGQESMMMDTGIASNTNKLSVNTESMSSSTQQNRNSNRHTPKHSPRHSLLQPSSSFEAISIGPNLLTPSRRATQLHTSSEQTTKPPQSSRRSVLKASHEQTTPTTSTKVFIKPPRIIGTPKSTAKASTVKKNRNTRNNNDSGFKDEPVSSFDLNNLTDDAQTDVAGEEYRGQSDQDQNQHESMSDAISNNSSPLPITASSTQSTSKSMNSSAYDTGAEIHHFDIDSADDNEFVDNLDLHNDDDYGGEMEYTQAFPQKSNQMNTTTGSTNLNTNRHSIMSSHSNTHLSHDQSATSIGFSPRSRDNTTSLSNLNPTNLDASHLSPHNTSHNNSMLMTSNLTSHLNTSTSNRFDTTRQSIGPNSIARASIQPGGPIQSDDEGGMEETGIISHTINQSNLPLDFSDSNMEEESPRHTQHTQPNLSPQSHQFQQESTTQHSRGSLPYPTNTNQSLTQHIPISQHKPTTRESTRKSVLDQQNYHNNSQLRNSIKQSNPPTSSLSSIHHHSVRKSTHQSTQLSLPNTPNQFDQQPQLQFDDDDGEGDYTDGNGGLDLYGDESDHLTTDITANFRNSINNHANNGQTLMDTVSIHNSISNTTTSFGMDDSMLDEGNIMDMTHIQQGGAIFNTTFNNPLDTTSATIGRKSGRKSVLGQHTGSINATRQVSMHNISRMSTNQQNTGRMSTRSNLTRGSVGYEDDTEDMEYTDTFPRQSNQEPSHNSTTAFTNNQTMALTNRSGVDKDYTANLSIGSSAMSVENPIHRYAAISEAVSEERGYDRSFLSHDDEGGQSGYNGSVGDVDGYELSEGDQSMDMTSTIHRGTTTQPISTTGYQHHANQSYQFSNQNMNTSRQSINNEPITGQKRTHVEITRNDDGSDGDYEHLDDEYANRGQEDEYELTNQSPSSSTQFSHHSHNSNQVQPPTKQPQYRFNKPTTNQSTQQLGQVNQLQVVKATRPFYSRDELDDMDTSSETSIQNNQSIQNEPAQSFDNSYLTIASATGSPFSPRDQNKQNQYNNNHPAPRPPPQTAIDLTITPTTSFNDPVNDVTQSRPTTRQSNNRSSFAASNHVDPQKLVRIPAQSFGLDPGFDTDFQDQDLEREIGDTTKFNATKFFDELTKESNVNLDQSLLNVSIQFRTSQPTSMQDTGPDPFSLTELLNPTTRSPSTKSSSGRDSEQNSSAASTNFESSQNNPKHRDTIALFSLTDDETGPVSAFDKSRGSNQHSSDRTNHDFGYDETNDATDDISAAGKRSQIGQQDSDVSRYHGSTTATNSTSNSNRNGIGQFRHSTDEQNFGKSLAHNLDDSYRYSAYPAENIADIDDGYDDQMKSGRNQPSKTNRQFNPSNITLGSLGFDSTINTYHNTTGTNDSVFDSEYTATIGDKTITTVDLSTVSSVDPRLHSRHQHSHHDRNQQSNEFFARLNQVKSFLQFSSLFNVLDHSNDQSPENQPPVHKNSPPPIAQIFSSADQLFDQTPMNTKTLTAPLFGSKPGEIDLEHIAQLLAQYNFQFLWLEEYIDESNEYFHQLPLWKRSLKQELDQRLIELDQISHSEDQFKKTVDFTKLSSDNTVYAQLLKSTKQIPKSDHFAQDQRYQQVMGFLAQLKNAADLEARIEIVKHSTDFLERAMKRANAASLEESQTFMKTFGDISLSLKELRANLERLSAPEMLSLADQIVENMKTIAEFQTKCNLVRNQLAELEDECTEYDREIAQLERQLYDIQVGYDVQQQIDSTLQQITLQKKKNFLLQLPTGWAEEDAQSSRPGGFDDDMDSNFQYGIGSNPRPIQHPSSFVWTSHLSRYRLSINSTGSFHIQTSKIPLTSAAISTLPGFNSNAARHTPQQTVLSCLEQHLQMTSFVFQHHIDQLLQSYTPATLSSLLTQLNLIFARIDSLTVQLTELYLSTGTIITLGTHDNIPAIYLTFSFVDATETVQCHVVLPLSSQYKFCDGPLAIEIVPIANLILSQDIYQKFDQMLSTRLYSYEGSQRLLWLAFHCQQFLDEAVQALIIP